MLDELRERVLAANLALVTHRLVKLTWGNVSGVDRDQGVMAIKASGVDYGQMTADDVVLVDLATGQVVRGQRRPSTDTPTHLMLYRAFAGVGGIVHTHSTWATAWAQAEREIPVLGTTHADLTSEPIPVTRALTAEEVERDYEGATGTVLIEAIGDRSQQRPGALVRGHGPFCWGHDAAAAVQNAVTLEEVARLALLTGVLEPGAGPLDATLRSKHYERKHGPRSYYGQS
ncbi:MAG TPA: L-ribulose-5-phosphate 4-epimerase AraD [Solirubrobacteraceae bacterium]